MCGEIIRYQVLKIKLKNQNKVKQMEQNLTAGNDYLPMGRNLDLSMLKSDKQEIASDLFKSHIQDSGKYIVVSEKHFKQFISDFSKAIEADPSNNDIILKSFNEQTKGMMVANVGGQTYFFKTKAESENNYDLEKGCVSEAFRYSDNLKFEKNGKEIKAKIAEQIVAETANSTAMLAKITEAKKVLDDNYEACEPKEEMDEWNFRGYKSRIAFPFKMYNWIQTEWYSGGKDSELISMPVGGSGKSHAPKSASSEEEAQARRDYNRAVRDYLDSLVEIATLNTISNGLDDKKKYTLNQNQFVALGF
jgi:hypothetical protein